eukprot:scaffold1178_cov252-Pinguiococcus_pyrenoidosus.AAC.34
MGQLKTSSESISTGTADVRHSQTSQIETRGSFKENMKYVHSHKSIRQLQQLAQSLARLHR